LEISGKIKNQKNKKMKSILDLSKALNDEQYYFGQFQEKAEKNILYLDTQLSGKNLYKVILPYMCMYSENVYTAIASLSKFDYGSQLSTIDIDERVGEQQILWADFIVINFTSEKLSEPRAETEEEVAPAIYDVIREINPECQIIFMVDFNFYLVDSLHPFYSHVAQEEKLRNIEMNIIKSDVCMVSNLALRKYLLTKLKEVYTAKYSNVPTKMKLSCMPLFIDSTIVQKNLDYNPELPEQSEDNSKHTEEVTERLETLSGVSDELKQKDLKKKKEESNSKPKKQAKDGNKSRKPAASKTNGNTTRSNGAAKPKPTRKRTSNTKGGDGSKKAK
jgi:uncharacterized protein YqfB (UPF0267 family)